MGLKTNLLFTDSQKWTHSLTELSLSWDAAVSVATQELPSILWDSALHYRAHKSAPLVPILNQIDPVHIIPSCLSRIRFNIVLVFLVSSLLAVPQISYMHSSSLPFVLHARPISSSLTWLFLAESTSYEAPHYEVLSPAPITSCLFGPNIHRSTLFLSTLSLCSSINDRD
jgi:hypothetical protein